MNNKDTTAKTELTEQDLYCIARFIKVDVLMLHIHQFKFKDFDGEIKPCYGCKYDRTCYEKAREHPAYKAFIKLGNLTGITMGQLSYELEELYELMQVDTPYLMPISESSES